MTKSGQWVRSLSMGSGLSNNNAQHRRSVKKERALLRTLATTVLVFVICWLPFGFCVLIDPTNINKHAKKVSLKTFFEEMSCFTKFNDFMQMFGWLAVTNSCINFTIYGIMNPVFRRGYKNLFVFIFTHKRAKKISSTALHASQTDTNR